MKWLNELDAKVDRFLWLAACDHVVDARLDHTVSHMFLDINIRWEKQNLVLGLTIRLCTSVNWSLPCWVPTHWIDMNLARKTPPKWSLSGLTTWALMTPSIMRCVHGPSPANGRVSLHLKNSTSPMDLCGFSRLRPARSLITAAPSVLVAGDFFFFLAPVGLFWSEMIKISS